MIVNESELSPNPYILVGIIEIKDKRQKYVKILKDRYKRTIYCYFLTDI